MAAWAALWVVLGRAPAASGDNTLQLWTNAMLEGQVRPSLFLSFDLEPKVLLVGAGGWRGLDLTTTAELAPTRWLDVIGELDTGYTNDTAAPDVAEVTPRIGARLYLLRSRLQLRDTWRLELRNRFFDDGTRDHPFRMRNRVELRCTLNRERPTETGAVILLADFEYFLPIPHDARERFASKYRIRVGVGHRFDERWRVDLLYMYERSRDTNTEAAPFDGADHIVDLRVRRAF